MRIARGLIPVLFSFSAIALAVPPEVNDLKFCGAQRNCLQWSPADALKYRLYRGEPASLPCVLNPSLDSCQDGTFLTTTTGPTINEVPARGTMFWFLVTAIDGSGEGSPGSATSGPRTLNDTGACTPSCSPAGSMCTGSNDCCSANCAGGICQSNCCAPTGALCSTNAECCNGSCSSGRCDGPCSEPASCPGSDTACATRTCTSGVCGVSYAPNGTLTPGQTPGDCSDKVCDGSGNIVSATDNADVPVDGNQCTSDTCMNGVPSNPAAPLNFPCSQNGGIVCNGAGACVQCNVASQCGTNTECSSMTCIANTCGVSNAPAGSPCTGGSCDGNGNCVQPPQVVSTAPADGATAPAGTSIAVTFSQAMNPATLTGQTTAGACSGSIQVSSDSFASCVAFSSAAPTMSSGNTVATLVPAPGLLVNRGFRIRVTTAAQSASNIGLASTYTQPSGFTTTSPNLCDGSLVISQVYGAGGLTGAAFRNDFIELHNRGTSPVSVAGMSVQYASATGSTWLKTNLSGTIPAGGYYLVQEFSGGTAGATLPVPDATGTTDMSSTTGKVALVSNQTSLTGTCPTGATVLDFVGYGTAPNCSEGGSLAPAPSATTAVLRIQSGCADVNLNGSDFASGTGNPRNSGAATLTCGCLALNESNVANEADYCVIQFPPSLSVQAGMSTGPVYGQLYEAGVTEPNGPPSNVRAQLGYGSVGANPQYQAGWTWFNASYNVQSGNNDEYQASFNAPNVGSYRYVYRFSLDQGVSWTVCDTDGAGANAGLAFDLANEGVLTVTP